MRRPASARAREADARKQLEEVKTAFADLQSRFGAAAPSAEVEPGPVVVPEPEPPPVPEPAPPPAPEPTPEPSPPPGPVPVPEPTPPPDEGTPPSRRQRERSKPSDAAGARLVAMNMALEGATREQIEAKLAAEYRARRHQRDSSTTCWPSRANRSGHLLGFASGGAGSV